MRNSYIRWDTPTSNTPFSYGSVSTGLLLYCFSDTGKIYNGNQYCIIGGLNPANHNAPRSLDLHIEGNTPTPNTPFSYGSVSMHKFIPITVSVTQEKFITEISIIGGAKPS